jgi:undecaprenyl-diphosphatase
VLAVAGGDGTVGAAASVAADRGVPLLVLPCGTLNHFARQLGFVHVDDALAALAAGCAARIDLGDADGAAFVNTASIGGYPELVRRREQLEDRIGKWPAMLVALAGTVAAHRPLDVELDGRAHRVWLVFAGNGRHEPAGLAPTWRPRLDEGLLDVRIVTADRRFARARVLFAAIGGRLQRCAAYEAWTAPTLDIRIVGEPQPLARDGEVGDAVRSVRLAKRPGALVAYRAPDAPDG